MKIRITQEIQNIISSISSNTIRQNSALKIYAGLYLRNNRQNDFGYFRCPTSYLKRLNSNYKPIMDYFIKSGLIKVWERAHENGPETIMKKYYDTTNGICMSYKFLMDTDGEEIFVDMKIKSEKNDKPWWNKIYSSLSQIVDEDLIYIKRDTFGRRVHHTLSSSYKKQLKGLWMIDCQASHPTILWKQMKNANVIDRNYNKFFGEGLDFYDEVGKAINLDDRAKVKDLFMIWLGGTSENNTPLATLFPIADRYIHNLKRNDYKQFCSHIQRVESEIWIDDIVGNIPIDFCIPIHDCIVVCESDIEKGCQFIKERHPYLNLKVEMI